MAKMNEPRDEAPHTTAFQLQLGKDGECRLAIYDGPDGAERTIAYLLLTSADADRLANELHERRRTYQKARERQDRSKH